MLFRSETCAFAEGAEGAGEPEQGDQAVRRRPASAPQAPRPEQGLDVGVEGRKSLHPEWFTILADGSIAYAENPPKKYQDIYPLNFDNDPEGIYAAILDVVNTWIGRGVTIFRVDNPHTKPLTFWQRLLRQIHAEHPDVLFLGLVAAY